MTFSRPFCISAARAEAPVAFRADPLQRPGCPGDELGVETQIGKKILTARTLRQSDQRFRIPMPGQLAAGDGFQGTQNIGRRVVVVHEVAEFLVRNIQNLSGIFNSLLLFSIFWILHHNLCSDSISHMDSSGPAWTGFWSS